MIDFNDPVKLEEVRKAKEKEAAQEERMEERIGLDDDSIVEAEFALLGGFVRNSIFLDEAPTLEPYHFGNKLTVQVFKILHDRHKRGQVTDHTILKHHLKDNPYLWDFKANPDQFIDTLLDAGVQSVLQIRSYAELILDHNAKIDLNSAIKEAQNTLLNPQIPALEVINRLNSQFTTLAPATADTIDFMGIDDVLALPSLEWAIEGYLQEVGLSCLYAPSFTGKSYLALDMALSIAQGSEWHGKTTKPLKVAYIAGEGARGMSLRANAWLSARQSVERVPFFFYRQPVDFFDPTQINHFIKLCENTGVRMVVVDTLARCFGGRDENSTQDMNAFVDAADRIKRAIDGHVMIVHHTGKEVDKGARGNTALQAAVDTEIQLKKDPEAITLKIVVKKQKDGDIGAPKYLEFEEREAAHPITGELIKSAILVDPLPEPGGEKGIRLGANERRILVVLANNDLGFTDIQNRLGLDKGTLGRALRSLQDKGQIFKSNDEPAVYGKRGESE